MSLESREEETIQDDEKELIPPASPHPSQLSKSSLNDKNPSKYRCLDDIYDASKKVR